MRKFVINVLLFLLPLLLYFAIFVAPFFYAGYVTHEFMNTDDCIELQRNSTYSLYGLGYSGQTSYYKLMNADYFQAPVIALGTSRVMQFKNKYFYNGLFYNCGGAVSENYDEYRNFLQNMAYHPQVIILGIDAWVFNDKWNEECDDYRSFTSILRPEINYWALSSNIRKDWKDKWHFSQLNRYSNNIGFNGRIRDQGFMIDGSYYYGDVYRNPKDQQDYRFVETLGRIANGSSRFEWGDHIDQDTLTQLRVLLEYCQKNNTSVIGLLVPFAPSVYTVINESQNYGYWDEMVPACRNLFEEFGYEFYDYLDVSIFPVSDECFIDGFHGSEVVYGYIVKDLCNNQSCLKKYVNEKKLDELLNNAFDGRTFFDPDKRPD